jgi:hypothetical protein
MPEVPDIPSPSAPAEPQAPPSRRGRTQRRWVIVCWLGAAAASLLAIQGTVSLFTGGPIAVLNWVPLIAGTAAAIWAASIATRLRRRGASDLWFIKGTTTARTICLGWLGVVLSIPIGAVAATILDLDTDQVVQPIAGVIGTLGVVAIVAMIGPGYTGYREAVHATTGNAWREDEA